MGVVTKKSDGMRPANSARWVVNQLPRSELCLGALYGAQIILNAYNGLNYRK